MDCTTRDDLRFKPPSFVCFKGVGLLVLCLFAAFGCGQPYIEISPAMLLSEKEEAVITVIEPEFSMAYVTAMEESFEFLAEEERIGQEEDNVLPVAALPLSDVCYQEELIGFTSCLIHEPELVEDPFVDDICGDSASSWCDPLYEDTYLTYLAEHKAQQIHADILPNFVSPIDEGLVLRGMQAPKKKRRGHYGIDVIPPAQNRKGVPIKSVEEGIIVKSSRARGYGDYVVVYHQNGIFSLYSHLLKNKRAKLGRQVSRGEIIGYMGKTGNARGYHLHFELIDLREYWNLDKGIDEFVQKIAEGHLLSNCECNQFNKLLFAKTSKIDPLQHVSGLAFAKRVNGKWVAASPIVPENAQVNATKQ